MKKYEFDGKPESFTIDSNDEFKVFYGCGHLAFPRELYEDHFEGDYQVVHRWLRKSIMRTEVTVG